MLGIKANHRRGAMDEKLNPPNAGKGDVAISLTRAGIAGIPVIGGSLVELFNMVVQPPLEKRRVKWMEIVAGKLEELEKKGVDIEALKNDEEFISTVMSASMIAIRTHKQEKLDALRNAVSKVAEHQGPDEAKQSIFLNLIDTLSVLHIQILKFSRAPKTPPNVMMGALIHVLQAEFPQLKGNGELAKQLWHDLYNHGLVNTPAESLNAMMTGLGLGGNRLSSLGAEFLNFIGNE